MGALDPNPSGAQLHPVSGPHPQSPSPFLLSFLCLPVFLCCLPAPQWVSLPVGGGEQGMGAMELMRTVSPGQRAAGWCGGLLDEGPAEAFGVAAQFVSTRASVPPSLTTTGACASFSAPVPNPRPCPLSVPLCLAIALSPAWVSDTMPIPGTVSSPVWCCRVQAQAVSQCQRAPSWMLSPGQCPQLSMPSGEILVPPNHLPPSLLSLPLSL